MKWRVMVDEMSVIGDYRNMMKMNLSILSLKKPSVMIIYMLERNDWLAHISDHIVLSNLN